MNILEIVILVLTAVFAVTGYSRGFVRKLASMLSFVISIVLVSVLLPYMTNFLKTSTPVYDYVVERCEQIVAENLSGAILSGRADSEMDSYREMGRRQIKELMEQYGYDSSIVDTLSDAQLEEYKEQYLEQYVQQYLDSSDEAASNEPTRSEQTELIDSLPIPKVLREMLQNYNNDDGYRSLGVSTFKDYMIHFMATAVMNVITFLASVILVQVLLHIVISALDILARLPLLGGLNRLLGLLLGLVQALFFIWLFFLILSMASAAQWGVQLMDMVRDSAVLTYLYDSNLFWQIVLRTAALFV